MTDPLPMPARYFVREIDLAGQRVAIALAARGWIARWLGRDTGEVAFERKMLRTVVAYGHGWSLTQPAGSAARDEVCRAIERNQQWI